MSEAIEIKPQEGPQTTFLSTSADIAIFGGGAGGGKSFGLLLESLRNINNPTYGGTIFRRTFSDIKNEGGLWDESTALYPQLGATSNESDLYWTFKSGATVGFAHLQHEKDIQNYQGAQMPFIGFDELTHFTERQFFYMLSRNRLGRCSGFKPYVRATCNPDADSWVAEFISWWIDEDGFADPSRMGILRYFYRINNKNHWGDTPEELMEKFPDLAAVAPPKSVTFILSTVYNNRILLEKDPGYLANLQSLDNIDQQRLLGDKDRGGNWKIRAEAGKVFNRSWFKVIDENEIPAGGTWCRFFDFAASEKKMKGDDPDFTASTLLGHINGRFIVARVTEDRMTQVDDFVKNTATQDRNWVTARGGRYMVRWEIEPGSASLREHGRMVAMLSGFDVAGDHSRGDKFVRSKAFAAQAKGGNVDVVQSDWTEGFLKHMHGQPDLSHDDIHDSAAGAFNAVNQGVKFGFAIA
jgi:phage terminase large subunit-like protein